MDLTIWIMTRRKYMWASYSPKRQLLLVIKKSKSWYINFVILIWRYPRITKERMAGAFLLKCKPNHVTKCVASFQIFQWYFSPSCPKYASKFSLDSSVQVPKKGSIMMESVWEQELATESQRHLGNTELLVSSLKSHLHHVTLLKWPIGNTKECRHQHWLILSTSKLRHRKLTCEGELKSMITWVASSKEMYSQGHHIINMACGMETVFGREEHFEVWMLSDLGRNLLAYV